MSRSIRGSKPGGYEYWSRRPFSGGAIGPFAKKRTHHTERQQGKKIAKESKELI